MPGKECTCSLLKHNSFRPAPNIINLHQYYRKAQSTTPKTSMQQYYTSNTAAKPTTANTTMLRIL
jgi:hypothetical protein